MRNLQIDSEIVASLELARESLVALTDPHAERCQVGATDGLMETGPRCECCGAGISDHIIKDAVKAYVQMWTLFPFDIALASIKGEATDGERSYLGSVSRGLVAGQSR
jgi:hypothetical protein